VTLNEIHYHPQSGEAEFIEILNLTGEPLGLHDENLGRPWRLAGPLNADETSEFEFPAGAAIPARGYALVVAMDPALFRARRPLPPEVPAFGPFGGALSNGGERLQLLRPLALAGGVVSYALVDEVRYDDQAPWPAKADGNGSSLERVMASEHGNDPSNWAASTAVGGTPGEANSMSPPAGNGPPLAAFSAAPTSGPAPLAVTFDAGASSDPEGSIAGYEWDFGDGSTATGRTAIHTFGLPGTFSVVLVVTDDRGARATATTGIVAAETVTGGGQLPGDLNQDGKHTISDAIVLLLSLLSGDARPLPCDAGTLASPGNRLLADLNGDAAADLADAIHLLTYLFRRGPEAAPGIDCIRITGCPDACVP
jgi:hypothetical protein